MLSWPIVYHLIKRQTSVLISWFYPGSIIKADRKVDLRDTPAVNYSQFHSWSRREDGLFYYLQVTFLLVRKRQDIQSSVLPSARANQLKAGWNTCTVPKYSKFLRFGTAMSNWQRIYLDKGSTKMHILSWQLSSTVLSKSVAGLKSSLLCPLLVRDLKLTGSLRIFRFKIRLCGLRMAFYLQKRKKYLFDLWSFQLRRNFIPFTMPLM